MSQYERTGTYPVAQIVPLIGNKRPRTEVDGDRISVASVRMRTFGKGTVCVCCGMEATHFAKERHKIRHPESTNGYHLNLYGLNEHGHEVLFTRDHIIPRSKGGPEGLSNMQTMCAPCNQRKGNGDKLMPPRYRFGHREYTVWECYNPNMPNKPRFYDARLVETGGRPKWGIARTGVIIAPTAKNARKQYVREVISS